MKKGFTLIELLIVMVLVGVLVTVALPKYYASMERGRSVEGVNNLRAASDYVNARYIMNGNSYSDVASYSSGGKLLGDFTKSVYFSSPAVLPGSTSRMVQIETSRESNEFVLRATNVDGELKEIECIPGAADLADNQKLCESIGFDKSGSKYVMYMK